MTPSSKMSRCCQSVPILLNDPMESGKSCESWVSVLVVARISHTSGRPKKIPNRSKTTRRMSVPTGPMVPWLRGVPVRRQRVNHEDHATVDDMERAITTTPFSSRRSIGAEESGEPNDRERADQADCHHQQRNRRRRAKVAIVKGKIVAELVGRPGWADGRDASKGKALADDLRLRKELDIAGKCEHEEVNHISPDHRKLDVKRCLPDIGAIDGSRFEEIG